ncbi:hypothetical protein [Albidovulum sp.]|jgi:uncharacterized membrane protein YphA (DoxX/SURF4 family)|uniref:hypothetical protein n=1 Tax=Albidovulum sp. TaxID=1872424 RepID=UPI00303A4D46
MPAAENTSHSLNQSGQNLVRIVIASYFLAVSVGLIPGTVASPLTGTVLPEPWAGIAGKAVVFATAYLVLVGAWLRVSALLLATVLFWSSYIANAGGGNLEAFWRDLALIGALILTYTQTLPRAAARRSALRWTPRVRRVTPAQTIVPRRVVCVVQPSRTAQRPAMPATPEPVAQEIRAPAPVLRLAAVRAAEPMVENIFRDDPEIAMAG